MKPLSYLALGWGVQSTTIGAMMALDQLPRADYLIHADTTHEKEATYVYAERMSPWLGEHGLTVITVSPERAEIVRPDWGMGSVMIPAFSVDREDGSHGQVRRQCTHDWKVVPIRRFIRQELKQLGRPIAPGAVTAIMGISADEWRRVRDSDVQYITNSYPLIDKKMTRLACLNWLSEHGIPTPPKSACTFCPYTSVQSWKTLRSLGDTDWQEALAADQVVREMRKKHALYVHPARHPLPEAVELPEDRGQLTMEFDEEAPCDSGHCFT